VKLQVEQESREVAKATQEAEAIRDDTQKDLDKVTYLC